MLQIIDIFIERNKNTIVNNEDSYRITLNRAPFSIIARYLNKCYFNDSPSHADFPFDKLELITPLALFQMRTKCLNIVQKYVVEVSQNIHSLNQIGGQNFAVILHNYEKKIFDIVFKIIDSQVNQLIDPSCPDVDMPARLVYECLQAVRVSKYHLKPSST